jgi:quercetin dioxygenase-like cupin family protein
MSLNIATISSEAPASRVNELREFFESLRLPAGRLDTVTLEKVTNALAARPDLFEDLLVDDEVNHWWHRLFATESYEVRLLTWESEQSSDWHDHGGSSGAWTVTAGALYETYRGDDYVSVGDRHYAAGDSGSFGPGHVHDVIYESGQPAVSIHAYSPSLCGLTVYDHTRFGFVAREFKAEEQRAEQRS